LQFGTSLSIGIEIGGTKTQVGIGTAEQGHLPDAVVRRPDNRSPLPDRITSTNHHALATSFDIHPGWHNKYRDNAVE
jgi:predicted NBD/HSP70 family sugar kinase